MRLQNGSVMRWIFLFAACSLCFAEDAGRPQCNSRRSGELWPRIANFDPALRSKLNHCGQLQMCSLQIWRYKWKPVSVHVSQLGKAPQPVSAACQAVMDEAVVKNTTAAVVEPGH